LKSIVFIFNFRILCTKCCYEHSKWADLVAHPPALLSISKQLPHAVTPAADEDGEESIEEEDDELDDLLLSSSEASSESGESIEAIVDDEVEKLLDAPDPSTDAADADADDERVNTATANDISNWEDGSSQHQMATVEKLRRQLVHCEVLIFFIVINCSFQANINERSYDRQSQRGDTSASLIRGLEQLRATRKAKNARALPAESFRQQIISSIRSNAVVIIAGETGCGKSTQVPQFILEDAIAAGWGADCNIVYGLPLCASSFICSIALGARNPAASLPLPLPSESRASAAKPLEVLSVTRSASSARRATRPSFCCARPVSSFVGCNRTRRSRAYRM